jgi:D,D-heptose 1,7-bisphosphate phosphatase
MPLTQCALLVGGLGTRLGALTQKTPKPLLPVGQRAFVDYLLDEIARHGFDEVVCLAGYRATEVQGWMRGARRRDLDIRVTVEPEPWGTAGALLAAKDILKDEFLLLNGDSIFDINLLDLATCKSTGDSLGTIALRAMQDTGRYGVVKMKGDRIDSFTARPTVDGSGLINGGVYRLKRQILDSIVSVPSSLERDVFPALARQGLLRGRVYDRFFLDIGTPEEFEAAQTLLPTTNHRPALFLDRDGVINKDIGYAHRPDQIEWIEGIFDAVKAANDTGLYVFVVTNQAGVARGHYDEDAVIELHQWMNREFRARGAHIDDFAYCPHHPTAGSGPLTRECDCRKPAPGMIFSLAHRWPIDLSRSLLVGDQDLDLKTAHNAGIAGMVYGGGSIRGAIGTWFTSLAQDGPYPHQAQS